MIDILSYNENLKKIQLKDINISKKDKIWLDITNISESETKLIEKKFKLHTLTTEDLLNSNTRTKIEEFEEYLFCVFHTINKKKKINLSDIDFIIGKNFIITNHKNLLNSTEKLKKDTEKLKKLFSKGVEYIFHKILDEEIDNYSPVLEELDDIVLDLESQATTKPSPELMSRILDIKRQLTIVRKTVSQQKEKISFLAKNEYKFISKKAIPYFRDIYDNIIRVNDLLENYRESIANVFDVYMSATSNNMNEIMKTLSIIATIALPLTVISGIYGTNFRNLPGFDAYWGFWVMIVLMILMILSMLYYFKRKNWF